MTKIRMFASVLAIGSLLGLATLPVKGQQSDSKNTNSKQNESSSNQNKASNNKNATSETGTNESNQGGQKEAFLGVAVEAVSPTLAAHLHDTLKNGQGVVVAQVDQHSPAAKAGIKQYDIILSFSDQRLFSPEQLVKLVRAEKPGSRQSIDILRNGQKKNLEVTLGEQNAQEENWSRRTRQNEGRGRMFGNRAMRMPRGMANAHHGGNRANWERFDSLTLQKTGKDQFKVAISYLDDKGKIERHEFQGSREQIHKSIQSEKDLPASERTHLLAALDMPQNAMVIPGVQFIPGQGLVIELDEFGPSTESQNPSNGQQF